MQLFNNERSCSGIIFNDISDNFPIFHVCITNSNLKYPASSTYRHIINDTTIDKLNSKLNAKDWDAVLKNNDVN